MPYIEMVVKGTLLAILILYCNTSYCQQGREEWLDTLNKAIRESIKNDEVKLRRIDSLQLQTGHLSEKDLFVHYLVLQEEYGVFNFDSAYFYANKLLETAKRSNDISLTSYASIKINSVLLSSGMFKEVFESLNQLRSAGLNNQQKAEFYALKARSYFDLADYNRDNIFTNEYYAKADKLIDSCLLFTTTGSFQHLYYNGLKSIRAGDIRKATEYFNKLSNSPGLSLREQAIINSTFSDIYIRRGMNDSAIILLAEAAIADIRSSTKETTAILNLATLLFKQGDIENASAFIQKAANDARTFGARQRMVQLSHILPVIEGERVATVEKEKQNIRRYAGIITILFALLIVLSIIIVRQVRKQRRQQQEIHHKNKNLHHLLEEKEWLLKEIHHRVKNNLHTITSLLESQSAYLKNEALSAIRNSQHRVFAMSIIHQKLYEPETNTTEIDMSAYIHELIIYLQESFETGQRIQFIMKLEPVNLDITMAVPVGLILNEAITNSLKYAFPGKSNGQVTISIERLVTHKLLFTVEDNGVGLPRSFDINTVNSLGMKLMKGLSDDIGAQFSIKGENGTRISVVFNADKGRDYAPDLSRK
jgi:two-component sensor histidine kinase